ncbi:MAG: hypothetical protein ACR2GY_07920 [Phycisphaerales bacterium]
MSMPRRRTGVVSSVSAAFRRCMVCSIVGCVVAAGFPAATALAYPTPSSVPTRWQLNFKSGELRLYVDPATNDAYWWFTYKVTNFTGNERYWAPRLTLFTDRGEIMDAGQAVPPRIERELIAYMGNELLERQNTVIGKIFVGEPNAIEGLAVWPAERLDASRMSLFVTGISGETVEVTDPVTGSKVIMQKTLQRDYLVPGDPLARGDSPAEVQGERWVMR